MLGSHSLPHPMTFVNWHFYITPVAPDTKRPIYQDWPTRVVGAWQFPMDHRIGLICGRGRCGQLFAVGDLDHKPERGLNALDTYTQFKAVAETRSYWTKIAVMHSTSGIAYHVCFRPAWEVGKSKLYRNGTVIGDLLGKGAQVVAQPPEHYLHGGYETLETLTDQETAEILADLGYDDKPEVEPLAVAPRTAGQRRPGDDFCQRGDVVGLLQHHGWTCVGRTSTGKTYWKRPGKEDDGHSATLGHHAGQFYVFSTDAAPFEAGKTYNAFGMYALLEHDGNYGAAAAELARNGFGDRLPVTVHQTPKKIQRAWLADATPARAPGRPTTTGPDRLFAVLQSQALAGQSCNPTNNELATTLNVSARSITRWLTVLKDQALIAIRDTPSGRWIDLTDSSVSVIPEVDNNSPIPQVVNVSYVDGTSTHGNSAREVVVQADRALCETCSIGELAPDEDGIMRCSYCECMIWDTTLANEGCELYENVRPRDFRHTLIADYVRTNGRPDLDDTDLERLIKRTWVVRREARADERFTAKLRLLSDRALTAKEKSLGAKIRAANAGGNRGQAFVFSHMAWLVGREQERREPLRKVMGRYDGRKRTLFDGVTQ